MTNLTNEQALDQLWLAAKQAKLSYDEHASLQMCAQQVRDKLRECESGGEQKQPEEGEDSKPKRKRRTSEQATAPEDNGKE